MRRHSFIAALLAASCATLPAMAQQAVDISLSERIDLVSVMPRDAADDVVVLDNLDIVATADLDALVGWRGGTAHVHVLNNLGGVPNDRAATLQGIDNIEVASQRLRLFEAWIEQQIDPRTSVRLGLYDLNSEFYSNAAAGLLIAPAFGVGSEIAATGPNGPSIFPSTALAVRFDRQLDDRGSYVRAALLNASAGTLGDPQGVDLSFDHGALLIGEVGIANDRGKIGLGGWTYSDRHDDIVATDGNGDPIARKPWGVYAIGEVTLRDGEGRPGLAAFARAGLSDGRTTPFKGGWQAGLLVTAPIPGRADSQMSLGANQAYLSHGYRQALRASGTASAAAETAFELTYADKLAPWLTLQPDVQLILDPAGARGSGPVLVAALRTRFDF